MFGDVPLQDGELLLGQVVGVEQALLE